MRLWAAVLCVVALAGAHEAAALEPPPPTLAITSVFPNVLRSQGGDVVTITGTNFSSLLRVVIGTRDAFVMSVMRTQIVVITPPADITSGQTLPADVTVKTNIGTSDEASVTAPHAVTYTLSKLTPSILTVSPTAGSVTGGTRVAILGDGFQMPVVVTRVPDGAEMQVIRVTMTEIDVVMPPSESGLGVVGFAVWNVASDKRTSIENVYRYLPPAAIHSVGPLSGPLSGGTTITIDGENFGSPSYVTVAGLPAKVVESNDTRIVAVTAATTTSVCRDITGPITVFDYDGNNSTGPQFRYIVPHSSFASIDVDGSTMNVTVANAGYPRFTFGGQRLIIGTTLMNGDGTITYALPFPQRDGVLVFTNLTTGCTASQRLSFCCESPRRGRGAS